MEAGGGATVVGSVLIEKNATVSKINATHNITAPIAMIVSIAPISISIPVVPKSPTPVFSESVFSDFL